MIPSSPGRTSHPRTGNFAAPMKGFRSALIVPTPLAAWFARVRAALVDAGPLLFFALWNRGWAAVAFGVAYIWLLGHLDGVSGQTPGKALLGLRLVGSGGSVVGKRVGVARKFLHLVDLVPLGLGFLIPLVHVRRQTLADQIVSTFVVAGVPPRRFSLALWLPPRSD